MAEKSATSFGDLPDWLKLNHVSKMGHRNYAHISALLANGLPATGDRWFPLTKTDYADVSTSLTIVWGNHRWHSISTSQCYDRVIDTER